MLNTDEIISYTQSLLSYGYNPKEFIFFFNPKDIPVETMQEVAKKLGGIECESADYLIDGKIYILKKKDIDEFNLTWDEYGNRIEYGYWVKDGIPKAGDQHYQCTNCKYSVNFGIWGDLYTKEFKFCPNCGIRMKGEKK